MAQNEAFPSPTQLPSSSPLPQRAVQHPSSSPFPNRDCPTGFHPSPFPTSYVASPITGFSPSMPLGLSPFSEFARGLPNLQNTGVRMDGGISSPMMRQVMLHHGFDSPKKIFKSAQSHDPFDDKPENGAMKPGVEGFESRRRGCNGADAPNKEHKPCSCKKSRCLKKYCECFAAGKFCEGCYCTGCQNAPGQKAEDIDKNASAATPVVLTNTAPSPTDPNASPSTTAKGCHCKKSRCQKKYCECFQMNVLCSSKCECRECKNRTWDDRSPTARERGVQPKKRPRGGRPPAPIPLPVPLSTGQHMNSSFDLEDPEKAGNSPGLDTSTHSELDMTFVGPDMTNEALTTDTPNARQLHPGQLSVCPRLLAQGCPPARDNTALPLSDMSKVVVNR